MNRVTRYLVRNTVAGYGYGQPVRVWLRESGVSPLVYDRVVADILKHDVVPGPGCGPGIAYYYRSVISYRVEWVGVPKDAWWLHFWDNGDWVGKAFDGSYPVIRVVLRGGGRAVFNRPEPVPYERLPNYMRELFFMEYDMYRLYGGPDYVPLY